MEVLLCCSTESCRNSPKVPPRPPQSGDKGEMQVRSTFIYILLLVAYIKMLLYLYLHLCCCCWWCSIDAVAGGLHGCCIDTVAGGLHGCCIDAVAGGVVLMLLLVVLY